MRITNDTRWRIEAVEVAPDGAIMNSFGFIEPKSTEDLEIAIYLGVMGEGECRRPMTQPVTLIEASRGNKDGQNIFTISRESPVGIKATERSNQLCFEVK